MTPEGRVCYYDDDDDDGDRIGWRVVVTPSGYMCYDDNRMGGH